MIDTAQTFATSAHFIRVHETGHANLPDTFCGKRGDMREMILAACGDDGYLAAACHFCFACSFLPSLLCNCECFYVRCVL